jgi:RND family efflux transporter MFP subunit
MNDFTWTARRKLLLAGLLALTGAHAQDNGPASLETVPAGYEVVAVERVFDGTVEAVHQATVSAQTGGRIAEVGYDVDDFVEAGAVLIRFTDVEQRTALRQAEAQLSEARAMRTVAEEEYRRAQNLQARGLGSQRDLDSARAAQESAVARVASAESAVEAATQRLGYTIVTAPYAGIVTQRHIEVGETVAPGQPLFSGLSLERLRVAVDLPQSVAAEVRRDPSASLITAEGPVAAEKVTLFPVADPVTNTFRVRLDLPAGQFGLYPGMFIKTVFPVGAAQRLLIPHQALLQRSEVTGVYVVTDESVRLRQVRVGQRFRDRVEILAGLDDGERVALDPVQAGMVAKARVDQADGD